MYIEVLLLGVIIFAVLTANGYIKPNKFIQDNQDIFLKLKEEDYAFLVKAKYGDGLDPDVLFNKRIRNGLIVMVLVLFVFISNISGIKVVFAAVIGFLVFKLDYMNLKNFYKAHLQTIDSMLPHYLKGLEILIQHYTVPVAIGKSISDAPEIFRDGLVDMINKINAGDATINPYMEFAYFRYSSSLSKPRTMSTPLFLSMNFVSVAPSSVISAKTNSFSRTYFMIDFLRPVFSHCFL